MSISYIKGSAGLTSVDAAEKIKVNYVENLKRDPYLKSRLLPVASEGLTNGGGLYRFQTPLGKDVAVRRTGAPTSSTVDYTPGMNVEEVSLTVSQPFMTPTYVMEAGDVVQLDGINYSGILATQIVEALVEAEILNEEAGVVAASKTEKSVAASTALDKFKEIKKVIGHYANIDEANTFWTGTDAAQYFTGKGIIMPTNIYIHMTPATRMELSNALTDAGTGSEAQFAQFTVGSVPTIAGVEVIDNPYMPEGIIRFMPTNVIGTPDMDVMMTRISVGYDENQLVDTNTGQHYFDSVVITPELIVELTFTAPVKADIKEAKSEAKEAKADMEKLVKELVKAEAEAAKQAEKEAKKAAKAEAEAQKTAELEAKQAEAKAKAQAARVEAQRKAAEAANLTK